MSKTNTPTDIFRNDDWYKKVEHCVQHGSPSDAYKLDHRALLDAITLLNLFQDALNGQEVQDENLDRYATLVAEFCLPRMVAASEALDRASGEIDREYIRTLKID